MPRLRRRWVALLWLFIGGFSCAAPGVRPDSSPESARSAEQTSRPPHLVAVLPLDFRQGKLDAAGQLALEESLRTITGELLGPLGYTVLTRDTTLQVLADNGIDVNRACDDQTCALGTAREMKTTLFVAGTVATSEGEHLAFIRLYDTQAGVQKSAIRLEGKTVRELRKGFDDSAPSFFQRAGLAVAGAAPAKPAARASAEAVKPVDTCGAGLKIEYFNLPPFTAPPALTGREPDLVQRITSLDSPAGRGSPAAGVSAEYYGVRVTGEMLVEMNGTYLIEFYNDSGTGQATIGSNTVSVNCGADACGGGGGTQERGSFFLEKGWKPFVFNYVHGRGYTHWKIQWRRPGDSDLVPIAPTLMRVCGN